MCVEMDAPSSGHTVFKLSATILLLGTIILVSELAMSSNNRVQPGGKADDMERDEFYTGVWSGAIYVLSATLIITINRLQKSVLLQVRRRRRGRDSEVAQREVLRSQPVPSVVVAETNANEVEVAGHGVMARLVVWFLFPKTSSASVVASYHGSYVLLGMMCLITALLATTFSVTRFAGRGGPTPVKSGVVGPRNTLLDPGHVASGPLVGALCHMFLQIAQLALSATILIVCCFTSDAGDGPRRDEGRRAETRCGEVRKPRDGDRPPSYDDVMMREASASANVCHTKGCLCKPPDARRTDSPTCSTLCRCPSSSILNEQPPRYDTVVLFSNTQTL